MKKIEEMSQTELTEYRRYLEDKIKDVIVTKGWTAQESIRAMADLFLSEITKVQK